MKHAKTKKPIFKSIIRKTNYTSSININSNKDISNLLIKYRKQNKLELLKMASLLGVNFNTYLKMEKDYDFNISEIVKICNKLNLKLNISILNKKE